LQYRPLNLKKKLNTKLEIKLKRGCDLYKIILADLNTCDTRPGVWYIEARNQAKKIFSEPWKNPTLVDAWKWQRPNVKWLKTNVFLVPKSY
jgi:hypothetical protein